MSQAGAMRERVDLLAPTAGTTEAGDRYETFTTYAASVHARMKPKGASDIMRAMREVNETKFEATIRQRPDIAVDHRIQWGARVFRILAVKNTDERGHYLTLDLVEIAI